ncbi:hypothetical protein BVRB_7g162530 isoform A [Beta vulgaris subsp. vulgaris]|nr:hypothetical protein BVRB_7g162530 isoform A [Beta vulgaris subsp. vulgaris]
MHQCSEDDEGILSQCNSVITIEVLKETLAIIKMYMKLEALLLQKKAIQDGDSFESYDQKVNKLNVMLESLSKTSMKAERNMSENRSHKSEALHFRLVKATDVSQIEKELQTEIETLEKKKKEVEFVLQKVNTSLVATKARLHNAREERNQFAEANNGVLLQLQLKEKELSKANTSYIAEAKVVNTWMRFLEDTWNIQLAFSTQTEEQMIDELEEQSKHHTERTFHLLYTYKVRLENLVTRFQTLKRRLKSSDQQEHTAPLEDESFPVMITKTCLEEEYLDLDTKLRIAFTLVEDMKQIYNQNEDFPRCYTGNDEQKIAELFNILEKMKVEFESLERPNLEYQSSKELTWHGSSLKLKPKEGSVKTDWNLLDFEEGTPECSSSTKLSKSHKDIIDWEFDALGN